jgi:hypothetical protein
MGSDLAGIAMQAARRGTQYGTWAADAIHAPARFVNRLLPDSIAAHEQFEQINRPSETFDKIRNFAERKAETPAEKVGETAMDFAALSAIPNLGIGKKIEDFVGQWFKINRTLPGVAGRAARSARQASMKPVFDAAGKPIIDPATGVQAVMQVRRAIPARAAIPGIPPRTIPVNGPNYWIPQTAGWIGNVAEQAGKGAIGGALADNDDRTRGAEIGGAVGAMPPVAGSALQNPSMQWVGSHLLTGLAGGTVGHHLGIPWWLGAAPVAHMFYRRSPISNPIRRAATATFGRLGSAVERIPSGIAGYAADKAAQSSAVTGNKTRQDLELEEIQKRIRDKEKRDAQQRSDGRPRSPDGSGR